MLYVLKEDYDKVKDNLMDKQYKLVEVDKVLEVQGMPIKLYKVNEDKSKRMDLGKTIGGESNERPID